MPGHVTYIQITYTLHTDYICYIQTTYKTLWHALIHVTYKLHTGYISYYIWFTYGLHTRNKQSTYDHTICIHLSWYQESKTSFKYHNTTGWWPTSGPRSWCTIICTGMAAPVSSIRLRVLVTPWQCPRALRESIPFLAQGWPTVPADATKISSHLPLAVL